MSKLLTHSLRRIESTHSFEKEREREHNFLTTTFVVVQQNGWTHRRDNNKFSLSHSLTHSHSHLKIEKVFFFFRFLVDVVWCGGVPQKKRRFVCFDDDDDDDQCAVTARSCRRTICVFSFGIFSSLFEKILVVFFFGRCSTHSFEKERERTQFPHHHYCRRPAERRRLNTPPWQQQVHSLCRRVVVVVLCSYTHWVGEEEIFSSTDKKKKIFFSFRKQIDDD